MKSLIFQWLYLKKIEKFFISLPTVAFPSVDKHILTCYFYIVYICNINQKLEFFL